MHLAVKSVPKFEVIVSSISMVKEKESIANLKINLATVNSIIVPCAIVEYRQ